MANVIGAIVDMPPEPELRDIIKHQREFQMTVRVNGKDKVFRFVSRNSPGKIPPLGSSSTMYYIALGHSTDAEQWQINDYPSHDFLAVAEYVSGLLRVGELAPV